MSQYTIFHNKVNSCTFCLIFFHFHIKHTTFNNDIFFHFHFTTFNLNKFKKKMTHFIFKDVYRTILLIVISSMIKIGPFPYCTICFNKFFCPSWMTTRHIGKFYLYLYIIKIKHKICVYCTVH